MLEYRGGPCHYGRMEIYIALISPLTVEGIKFISEQKLIVLAASPSEAEVAFKKHTPGCNVKMTGEQPSPSFLDAA
jgi:hypothetical protein